MASKGKKKTTMAKLNRERRLIERRHAKKAKKDARKLASAEGTTLETGEELVDETLSADPATAA